MPRGERKDPVWTKLPVPGVVTARRDSTQTRKLRQKRQEEEEQLKKQRRQAEEAARILARRWRQEDRGEGTGGRRAEGEDELLPEGLDAAGDLRDPDAPIGRSTVRSEREADPGGVWVVTQDARKQRKPEAEAAERKPRAEEERRRHPADVAAAFESSSRPEKRRRDQRSPSPSAGLAPPRREAAAPPSLAAASGSGSSSAPSQGPAAATAAAADSGGHAGKPKSSRKAPLAGVFGLDDSDEERESTARQMELAAAGRRQTFARRAGIAATGSSGSGSAAPRERELPKTLDPAEVYMRCSQWKQSCNGKEMPMPEELRRALVEVTGNALGHSTPTPARRF